jgi:hypothetical protein
MPDDLPGIGGDRYGVLEVTARGGRRWDVALERLAKGYVIRLDGVEVRLAGGDFVEISTVWTSLRRPSERDIASAFDHAHELFDAVTAGSSAFRTVVADHARALQLVEYDGVGGVVLAKQQEREPSS